MAKSHQIMALTEDTSACLSSTNMWRTKVLRREPRPPSAEDRAHSPATGWSARNLRLCSAVMLAPASQHLSISASYQLSILSILILALASNALPLIPEHNRRMMRTQDSVLSFWSMACLAATLKMLPHLRMSRIIIHKREMRIAVDLVY